MPSGCELLEKKNGEIIDPIKHCQRLFELVWIKKVAHNDELKVGRQSDEVTD